MSAALIARLRYQLQGPRITTMGPCARGCGNLAKGSDDCRHCLTADLAEIVGHSQAHHLAASYRQAAEAEWAKEDATERAQA